MERRSGSRQKLSGYLERIVGPDCGEKIPLYDFDILIGRSRKAYICSTDVNVSRIQCSLKYTSTGWLIKDSGSVNGTFVNDIRISDSTYASLTDGCVIYVGPSEDSTEGYRFESVKFSEEISSESEGQRRSPRSKASSQLKLTNNKAVKRKLSPVLNYLSNNEEKTNCATLNEGVSNIGNINFLSSRAFENNLQDGYHSDSSISSLDSLRTRIRKADSAQKRKEKRAKYCSGDDLGFPTTSSVKQSFDFGSSFGRLTFLGAISDDDSQSLINKDGYNDWNMECNDFKEKNVKNTNSMKFTDSGDSNSSSVAVQSNLLKVLQKKVNDLQKTLKTLNMKFSETMNENAKLVDILKSKERAEMETKDDFKKLLEEEMVCQICAELYIKPITLGCSHTFCQHCIFEWKKKKKQCPMCREKIQSETTVLFMDNFINKAVEQLDPVSLEKRLELIKKREEQQKKKPKRKAKKAKSTTRRSNVPIIPVDSDGDDEVELLRSRISDIQSYTDDIQIYVDAIDHLINTDDTDEQMGYYGGYGRCYNCGRSGHWANACPH